MADGHEFSHVPRLPVARPPRDEEEGPLGHERPDSRIFRRRRISIGDARQILGQAFWPRLVIQGMRVATIDRYNASYVFYEHGGHSIVNLSQLQRLNLHALQKRLLDGVGELVNSEEREHRNMNEKQIEDTMGAIKEAMADYVNAVRDYDYMADRKASDPTTDPFILTSARTLDLCLMIDAKLVKARERGSGPLDWELPDLPGKSRRVSNLEKFRERFFAALACALSLLLPMLLMVLHKTLLTTLLTSSVCVFSFALAVSYFARMESIGNVVSLVAAYTAVLVVFIGTST